MSVRILMIVLLTAVPVLICPFMSDVAMNIRALALYAVCRISGTTCPMPLNMNIFLTSIGWYSWAYHNVMHMIIAVNRLCAIVLWNIYQRIFVTKVNVGLIIAALPAACLIELPLMHGYFPRTYVLGGDRLVPLFKSTAPQWAKDWAFDAAIAISALTAAVEIFCTICAVLYLRFKTKTPRSDSSEMKFRAELKLSLQALVVGSGTLVFSGSFFATRYDSSNATRAAVEVTMLINHILKPIVMLSMDKNIQVAILHLWRKMKKLKVCVAVATTTTAVGNT